MKFSVLILLLGSLVGVPAYSANTWCSCKTERGTEINPPNHDQFWQVQGAPRGHSGKPCGQGGFVLHFTDDYGGFEWLGPVQLNVGTYLNCFVH